MCGGWQRTRGSSEVVIGIVDEGVQVDHPLLGPNIQRDLAHNPASAGSHEISGTHAAGVAAGRFSEVERFSGVAPDARILSLRQTSDTFQPVGARTDPNNPNTTQTAGSLRSLACAIVHAANVGAQGINISEAACSTTNWR